MAGPDELRLVAKTVDLSVLDGGRLHTTRPKTPNVRSTKDPRKEGFHRPHTPESPGKKFRLVCVFISLMYLHGS